MSTQTSELGMVPVVDNATGEIFEVLGCMIRSTLSIRTRSGLKRYRRPTKEELCQYETIYGK